ncbi:hypothetical protein ABEB36_003585 [Hypothenemus hampei]|uniref:Dynein heavy chain 14, axonemal n=1 Tax=Hypothenemus hampei TaxID=57062 RepID=A0ABD1F9Q6_HYPHA
MEKRWILHENLIKTCLNHCVSLLPQVLFTLEISSVQEIQNLVELFREKLQTSSMLVHDFHKNLQKIYQENENFSKAVSKCLPACTGLFSIYLSQALANTLELLANFPDSKNVRHFLKLYADFQGKLILRPTESNVIEVFHKFLDDIIRLGENLKILDKSSRTFWKIRLFLTEDFIQKCKNKIEINISNLYKPVLKYLESLDSEFVVVYPFITVESHIPISQNVSREDGFQKISYFSSYIRKVTYIPNKEFFKIGHLDLEAFRDQLHKALTQVSRAIFQNLSIQHLCEVTDICDNFRLIHTRATQVPSTTEELIEIGIGIIMEKYSSKLLFGTSIGKFMALTRDQHLDTLNERVCNALKSLGSLITIGYLDMKHIRKNSEGAIAKVVYIFFNGNLFAVIKWPQKIMPVIEQHAINFEQAKFEAEERLQKVIEDINLWIVEVHPLLTILDDMDDAKLVRNYLNKITLHMSKIKEIQNHIEWVNEEEVCLNFPKSTYLDFENLKDHIYTFYHLLKLTLDVQKRVSIWTHGQLDMQDYEEAQIKVQEFLQEFDGIKKSYRKKIRQAQDENLPLRFKGTVDDPDMLNWPAPLKLCGTALNILENFKPSLIVMKIMCNKDLRTRHWKAMSILANFDLTPNTGTTLEKMVNYNLEGKFEEFEIISKAATKEQKVWAQLKELKQSLRSVGFKIKEVLIDLDSIDGIVEDQMMELTKMRLSVFAKPFANEIEKLSKSLCKISEFTNAWTIFQNVYLQLKALFEQKLVCKEVAAFEMCQNIFIKCLNIVQETPGVYQVVLQTNILIEVKECLKIFRKIQISIQDYLEVVRNSFPRLYFISDQELLKFIGKNEEVFQRVFIGVHQVKITENQTTILSSSGEEIILINVPNNSSTSTLQSRLKYLYETLSYTLKYKTAECMKIFKKRKIVELLQQFPEQSLQISARLTWTENVETSLKLPHNVKTLICKKNLQDTLEEKLEMLHASLVKHSERVALMNLICTDLNLLNSINSFLRNTSTPEDFRWQIQLKMFRSKDSKCFLKILNYHLDYGYEYLGNSRQIILTPTTEKCHVALLNTFIFNYFACLTSHTKHTGKTTTCQILAEALGRFHFIFKCIKELPLQMFCHLIKGTILSGTWLLLENAHQVEQETLSVVTQQLQEILECKRLGINDVRFENETLHFDKNCFIVLLQTGIKKDLPENFKVSFRTYTLVPPEMPIIVEGLMVCKGFKEFKKCSKTLCYVLNVLAEILSIDIFNLNIIKRILKSSNMCEGIWEVVMPGLTSDAKQEVQQILTEIFQENYELTRDFSLDIHTTLSLQTNLPLSESFIEKTWELYHNLKILKPIVLFGKSFTGKSTALNLCLKLLENLDNSKIELHIIYPQECFISQNFIGKISMDINVKWTDGFLMKMLRNSPENSRKLVVFDGEVENNWANSIINILDNDNLYLETLEIVKFNKSISFLFETDCLKDAAPSMISRFTTIYFPPNTVHYTSLITHWLNSCQSEWLLENLSQIKSLFFWFIPPCLDAIGYTNDDNIVKVQNVLTYFQMILDHAISGINKKDEDPKNIPPWIHATFIQAGFLGFTNWTCEGIERFDEFYKNLWKGLNEKYPYPVGFEKLEVSVPQEGLLMDYCYLYKQRGAWKVWNDLVKNEKILEYENGFFVPTVDVLKYNFVLNLHLKYKKNVLIIGTKCSGKSILLKNWYARKSEGNDYQRAFITAYPQLTSKKLKQLFQTKFDLKKLSVCFLDDFHCSSFGAMEFLRHQFNEETSLNPLVIATSQQSLPKRLQRHFVTLKLYELSHETMMKIFTQSLTYCWKKSGFPNDVLTNIDTIIQGSLCIHHKLKNTLKLNLNKCHYMFDIRCLVKVLEGLMSLKKETFDGNKKIYLKLWCHEILRSYADMLDSNDGPLVMEWMKEELDRDDFKGDVELGVEETYFGVWPGKTLLYEEISLLNFREISFQNLKEYNEKFSQKIDLYFFDYALEKLIKICRLFSKKHCNALLIGTTGLGRMSLTKFACFMYNYEYYQGNSDSLSQNLKEMWKISGGMNQKCLFFVEDDPHISYDFLQIFDCYLRGSEVANFFDLDEVEEVWELTRLTAQKGNEHLDVSCKKIFEFFNKNCRENLRIFLSMTLKDQLRKWLCTYPSLVTRTDVILWQDWPDEAFAHVGNCFMQQLQLNEKEKIVKGSIGFHRICQNSDLFITPKAYFHLQQLFVQTMQARLVELQNKFAKFQKALMKLEAASSQIQTMQKALEEYQPRLEAMTLEAAKMTEEIAKETLEVEKASNLVRKDEKIASDQAAIAEVLKSECEAELAQAIPILEDAISALNTLKPADITLVKSMKNPPDAIKLVMASVCVVKEVKPDRIPEPSTGRKFLDYWGPSKRILGDLNFLQSLKDFDKDHIKPEIIAKIRKDYLPHKDFKPQVVAKASSAAEGLCKWIIAMDMYDRVAKEVAPKKEKLHKAEKDYAETMKVLTEKKLEVMRIEERLKQLNILLEEAMNKQVKLRSEVEECCNKLRRAENLVGSLSGERNKWRMESDALLLLQENLSGDVLLGSGFLAYLAVLNAEDRLKLLEEFKNCLNILTIPWTSKSFSLSHIFPGSIESVNENCIILENCKQFHIIFDPHGQFINHIQSLDEVIQTKFSYDDWLEQLKLCFVAGKAIIIKDTERHLPEFLQIMVFQESTQSNLQEIISIDVNRIKYHDSNKLFIVSRKEFQEYPEKLTSKITWINFSMTFETLQDHIIQMVLEFEKPQVKKLSENLKIQFKKTSSELETLESKVLDTLCQSETADILEDFHSIQVLNHTKELIRVAVEMLQETKEQQNNIKTLQTDYVSIGRHVASLFFCLETFGKLHHSYRWSLKWFKEVFLTSIALSGKSKSISQRCEKISDTFTLHLFKSVSRGLLEKHKIFLAFCIAIEIGLKRGDIKIEEVSIFFNRIKPIVKEHWKEAKPEWVNEEVWTKLLELEQVESFQGVREIYVDKLGCLDEIQGLSFFAKLVLVKVLNPELLKQKVKDFITKMLGGNFLESFVLNMQEVLDESHSLMPIVFHSSSGVNVLDILKNFAKTKRMLNKFKYLNMNADKSKKVLELIMRGQQEGAWILLENCHLTSQWLVQLEKYLASMNFENTHENFRLFLTARDLKNFPLELMENCMKIVDKPPQSCQRKLCRLFYKNPIILDDYYYGCPGQQDIFSKLIFKLCHFHCLLQEKWKLPTWNLLYEFQDIDLEFSLGILKSFVNEGKSLMEKVHFVIGQCCYNGCLFEKLEKGYVSELLDKCLISSRKLPIKCDRRDYLEYICKLPIDDAFFGMSPREIRELDVMESKAILKMEQQLLKVQNFSLTHYNEVQILDVTEDLLNNFPEEFHGEIDQPFLKREIYLYNELLRVIKDALESIRDCARGEMSWALEIEEVVIDLMQNKVPRQWLKLCFPNQLSLSRLAKVLKTNLEYLANEHVFKEILLRSFFYPKSIICHLKLNFAKSTGLCPENIHLKLITIDEVIREVAKLDESIMILKGLCVFGARFDSGKERMLLPLEDTSEFPYTPLTALSVKFDNLEIPYPKLAEFPIYRTQPISHGQFKPGISNFIMPLYVKSKDSRSNSGVYFLCEF